jgi:hypothetical protein
MWVIRYPINLVLILWRGVTKLSGAHSPRHGVSSGCGWRRRPPDGGGGGRAPYVCYVVSENRLGVVLQLGVGRDPNNLSP